MRGAPRSSPGTPNLFGEYQARREVLCSTNHCMVLTAALLCTGLPTWNGPGKELAAANCNSCHTLLSRVPATTPLPRSSTSAMSARRAVAYGPMYKLEQSCPFYVASVAVL